MKAEFKVRQWALFCDQFTGRARLLTDNDGYEVLFQIVFVSSNVWTTFVGRASLPVLYKVWWGGLAPGMGAWALLCAGMRWPPGCPLQP